MLFDFCPNSRVAEEIAPEATKATTMNGWDFTSRPALAHRPTFKVTLEGLRWFLAGDQLDVTTRPEVNAGRLRQFYVEHLTWKTFLFEHEYLGTFECRFSAPVSLPKALPSAGGLLPSVEVTLIAHSPSYTQFT